jgi:GT2 family glycosyltransferase
VFELEDACGDGVEVAAPPVVRDRISVRNTILGDLVLEPPYEEDLLSHHVHPAMVTLQAQNAVAARLAEIRTYGVAVDDPEVSIVVPLYGRTDLVEHQLAQFAQDPQLGEVDLIYVLDSPELAQAFDYDARQLSDLYRTSFRVAIVRVNCGYSAANNLGASIARGRLLLLMNSDVLPDQPGWLGELVAFHDATPAVGAVGAKLVYEDETIQHAGISFTRDPSTKLWANDHRFKGIHRHLPAADVPQVVDAVTGACLLISRELYQTVGGLRGAYVQGDFEDSDLCLRLMAEGFETWYVPGAELYHLEGQSYEAPLRSLTARYNSWLHTQVHGSLIQQLTTRARQPTQTETVIV